jgi:hypothetical protein
MIDPTSGAVAAGSSIAEGIAAARAGDAGRMRAWLEAGGAIDGYDGGGWTPLLWAAARGHEAVVGLLLDRGADAGRAHRWSGALALHLAGQSGSVACARLLLDRRPDLIDAVLDVNGHGVLLQAVFYGHLDLAGFLLQRGADAAITTARGLGPFDLAMQFQNQRMAEIVRPYDPPAAAKAAYYQTYLARIAAVVPPAEAAQQALADRLVAAIEAGLKAAASDPKAVETTLATVRGLAEGEGAEVNRLGGALGQPALIVAVTGPNGFPANPDIARLRLALATYLLDHGADPTLRERHPMAAQTVIRAAVFNHLDILKLCAGAVTPRQYTDAINEIPAVNGLTAMHDTVLRASMAAPDRFEGYLDQARWFVAHGGRTDIEDFAGCTQRNLAKRADNPEVRRRLLAALDG